MLTLLLVAMWSSVAQDRAPVVPSIDLATPFAPVLFSQDGRSHIAYELHITNFQPVELTLHALTLRAGGVQVVDVRDVELQRRLVRPGFRNDYQTPQVVGPGQRAIVNLWFELPPATAVRTMTQTVEFTLMRPSGPVAGVASRSVDVQPASTPLVIGPPLGSGQWVAIYDPLLKGGHRTALYTLEGRARIPGRFAIDFIAMPPSGAMLRNPSPRPADLNGFGSNVLAVADGTVAAALDDTLDDQPQPVAPEVASGNYIALDIGGGRFAFYEHLQKGSLRVKAGDRVQRGQVIARLGSSGSTSIGPHLHFHVADANSLLAAEGVPFGFDQFTVFGEFASVTALVNGEPWRPGQVARTWKTTRPSPNVVMSFR